MRATHQIVAFTVALSFAFASHAQEFPSRPLKIIQGSAPGGNSDTAARLLGHEMAKFLRQPIIVDTRLGGGGRIAAEAVAKSPPDGYTMLLVTGGHAVAGAAFRSLPYDTVESFTMISTASLFPFLFAVRADSPTQSLQALLELARSKPDTVTFGSSGTGATLHLAGELLGKMSGTRLVHVPYKGESQAMTGLLTGDTTFTVATPTTGVGQAKSGKITVLAVSSNTRWSGLPAVPTTVEAGVPGFDVRSWLGLATTAGTPRPVVDRLNAAMLRALEAPEVRVRLEAMGGEVVGSTPEQMRDRVIADVQRWTKVMAEANIAKQE